MINFRFKMAEMLCCRDDASFCCIVDRDGEVTDYIRNMYLLNRNKAHFAKDRTDKVIILLHMLDLLS